MNVCAVDGCERAPYRRIWCSMHYARWLNTGDANSPGRDWVNPLVCVCVEPDADPRRDFGMCQSCKRKPLAFMAVAS